jgi:Mg/Co/Ni transporter MgtE
MDTANLLVRQFVESHPRDAAQALAQLDIDEAVGIVKKLPFRAIGLLLERLAPHIAAAILQNLEPSPVREVLENMPPRIASKILQHLEQSTREEALSKLPERVARQLRDLMHYPPDTAGGMMEPRVATIPMYQIKESDKAGGSGANFIVGWEAETYANIPIIESVMIGTKGQQGISFLSRGQVIKEGSK